MSHYLVTVGQREYEISLEHHADHFVALVNGKKSVVQSHTLGESRSMLLINNRVQEVDVRPESDSNSRLVFMRGREIPVTIEAYSVAQIRKTMNISKSEISQSSLLSPMPGLIVSIEAKAGDKIKKGQPLIVIEAMKMENVVKAKSDNTVKSVKVSTGQSVDKDELLMEFE